MNDRVIPARVEILRGDDGEQENYSGTIDAEVGSFTTNGKPLDVVVNIEPKMTEGGMDLDERSVAARITPFQCARLIAQLYAACGEQP